MGNVYHWGDCPTAPDTFKAPAPDLEAAYQRWLARKAGTDTYEPWELIVSNAQQSRCCAECAGNSALLAHHVTTLEHIAYIECVNVGDLRNYILIYRPFQIKYYGATFSCKE